MTRHIAVIPARQNSKGFKFKNRILFRRTAEFVRGCGLYERVIVTSDDPAVLAMAKEYGFEGHQRRAELARDATPIKAVFAAVVAECGIGGDDYLWLFYIPIVHKDAVDFITAKRLVDEQRPRSLSSFIPARTHPYNCWRYDHHERRLAKFIPNELFNRQDLPEAWENYHYLYCCRADALPELDNNLLSAGTYPIFLPQETGDRLVEVDVPGDLERWRWVAPREHAEWLRQARAEWGAVDGLG